MSKLEELIQQYCPDGVEYVRLGGFATQWYRGAGIKKDEIGQEGIPCIRYGEIHTIYKIWFDKCVSHTDETKQPSKKYADYGDILFAITSEDIPFIGNSVAYMGKERIMVGGDIVVMKHTQNPKYISYALSTIDAVSQKGKGKVKSKVVHTNVPSLKEIVIPVPPLPVQEEIVRILDNFTELQAELQAELQKRKQQYNYYRDNLLSFEGRTDVQWKKLGKIASITTGRRFVRTDIRESGVPCFHYGDIYTYYGLTATKTKGYLDDELAKKLRLAQPNDVVVVCAGENDMDIGVGVAWLGDEPAVVHDACCILHHNQSSRYISHFLRTHNYHLQMKKYVKNGKISSLPASGLAEALIPLPSLEEQERIASILDRFDTLTNDLTAGLPAEIEKRRQQYEYYRDKLLTFKRKEA